jgi:glycosyltransferase involved in cell wall biosynthesis
MYHPNLLASIVGRLAGIGAICWNVRRSGFKGRTLPLSTRAIARLGGLLSYSLPDVVVYCAHAAAKKHVEAGYSRHRVAVIHNGIDTRIFAPSSSAGSTIRKELQINPRTALIGSVGRFHPDKDHPTLFKALQAITETHPDFRCLLLGPEAGPDNPELVQLVAEFGLTDRMTLLGAREDVPAVLNALDLHVTSSATEAFPNVIVEAMACGTPCVTTDVGDAREIIDGHGWVVPPRSPAALAAAISEALSLRSSPRWEGLRKAGRNHCEQTFSIVAMVGAYQSLWEAVSNRRIHKS